MGFVSRFVTGRRKIRRLGGAVATAIAVLGSAGAALAQSAVADFNGDYADDLAVGAPNGGANRGTVTIYFGAKDGWLASTPALTISGIQIGESYGAALAAGDFDGNGRFELAVGAPLWNSARGRVEIIQFVRSSSGSLVPVRLSFNQDTESVAGVAQSGDRFGAALATGDFDLDRRSDLAVGVPGDDIGTIVDAGAVNVLYGSPYGLNATRDQYWHQNTTGISGTAEPGDQFGFALVAGHFEDGFADSLAIGVPLEDISYSDQGAVHVIYGQRGYNGDYGGLQTYKQQMFMPANNAQSVGALYGFTLAAGNFDGEGYDDLAIGAPGASYAMALGFSVPSGWARVGVVMVLFSSHPYATGLSNGTKRLFQHAGAESGDLFGWALAAGDFNRDSFDDLAVGVPGQDIGGIADAGEVNVFYGRYLLGFDESATQVFTQGNEGVPGAVEPGDSFGRSLTAADFNYDGLVDLAIGAPFEDVGAYFDAGSVTVLHGNWNGIFPNGGRELLIGTLQTGAKFGAALTGGGYFNEATGPGGAVLTLASGGEEPMLRLAKSQRQIDGMWSPTSYEASTRGGGDAPVPTRDGRGVVAKRHVTLHVSKPFGSTRFTGRLFRKIAARRKRNLTADLSRRSAAPW